MALALNYNLWARRTRDDRTEHEHAAQDERARDATRNVAICPGVSVDHELDTDPPPSPRRDDATAARARAVFDPPN